MKLNQKLIKHLLLWVTPLVTGAVFVALPSFAASEAISGAQVDITNFSHNPLITSTSFDAKAFLALQISTSNKYENVSAFGNISFLLFDSNDLKNI